MGQIHFQPLYNVDTNSFWQAVPALFWSGVWWGEGGG